MFYYHYESMCSGTLLSSSKIQEEDDTMHSEEFLEEDLVFNHAIQRTYRYPMFSKARRLGSD